MEVHERKLTVTLDESEILVIASLILRCSLSRGQEPYVTATSEIWQKLWPFVHTNDLDAPPTRFVDGMIIFEEGEDD